MKYTTYLSGTVDLRPLPKANKEQIKTYLEEIYSKEQVGEIFSEDELTLEVEWEAFDDSEKFLATMHKIAKVLRPDSHALIMCTGEREGDIWGIVIKDNKVYTQRYELKAAGDPEEYEKVKKR